MRKPGYLLPMVMVFIVISLTIGFSIYTIGFGERLATKKRLWREEAFYLADGAAELAYRRVEAGDFGPIALAGRGVTAAGQFVPYVGEDGTTVESAFFEVTGQSHGEGVTIRVAFIRGGSFTQALFARESVLLENSATVDSYDSRLGSYGGTNVGDKGDTASTGTVELFNNAEVYGGAFVDGPPSDIILANNYVLTGGANPYTAFPPALIDLADVVIPPDLASLPYPVQGDGRFTVHEGSYTLVDGAFEAKVNRAIMSVAGGSYRFRSFFLRNGTTITLQGPSRWYIEDFIDLDNGSTLVVAPGAELVLYLGPTSTVRLANNSIIDNRTGFPKNVRIYSASTADITIYNNALAISCLLYAPDASVTILNNAMLFGALIGNNLVVSQNGEIHFDNALYNVAGDGQGPRRGRWYSDDWSKPAWKIR